VRALVLLALVPALAGAELKVSIDLTKHPSRPVGLLGQRDFRWAGFFVGPRDRVDPAAGITIGRCGCLLTSYAMCASSLLGGTMPWFLHQQFNPRGGFTKVSSLTPKYLDDFLNGGPTGDWAAGWGYFVGGGSTCGTLVYPWALSGLVANYDQRAAGLSFQTVLPDARGWAMVDEALLAGRPTVLGRTIPGSSGRHANVIVGWNAEEKKYLVWDPMWRPEEGAYLAGVSDFDGDNDDERYRHYMASVLGLMPIEVVTEAQWWLMFEDDPEPIELRVTDPRGRRTGYDPETGATLQEDPLAFSDAFRGFVDALGLLPAAPAKRYLAVGAPEFGTWGLELFGTGSGPYTLTIGTAQASGLQPHVTLTGTISPGEVRRYEVTYTSVGAATAQAVEAFLPRARAGNGAVAFPGDLVAFDGRGSSQVSGAITGYAWDFGDGARDTGAQVTHAYAGPGTYTARLTVTNSAGRTAEAERRVLVVNTAAGETVRASVAPDGSEADHHSSLPALSRDGRLLAFASRATNLVPGDTNGVTDVFVRDLQAGTLERVSVATGGAQAAGGSTVSGAGDLDLTADGRYVVFSSDSPNLVANDTDGEGNVFLHDRVTHVTEAVSLDPQGALRRGSRPTVSADGRYVAFESWDAIDPADSAVRADVYLRDRQAGVTTWVSRPASGAAPVEGFQGSRRPRVSADGRFVTFSSDTANLVPQDANGTYLDVFVFHVATGALELVSLDGADAGLPTGHSLDPALSEDGRFVVFSSDSPLYFPGDANGTYDVVLRDRQSGALERISVNELGEGANHGSFNATVSPDGRYVAFHSRASNLAPAGTGSLQYYVRDRQAGTTSRVSVSTAGVEASPEAVSPEVGGSMLAVAVDGTVAFHSPAANLVPGDANGRFDVFVRRVGPNPAASTPVANLGGPYVGWATGTAVPAAVRLDGRASKDPLGRPLTASWDFGDGAPAQAGGLVTTHAWTTPGRYTVTLTVSAGGVTSAPAQTEVEVLEALPPSQLSLAPCAEAGGALVVRGAAPGAHADLVAQGFDRGAGVLAPPPVTLSLPWGEAQVPTALPGLTFGAALAVPATIAPGDFLVTVDGGASAGLSIPCAPANRRPLAHAGGPLYEAIAGVPLALDGSGSLDPEGADLSWAWDFGDGELGTGVAPVHAWATPGTYLVSLGVHDGTLASTRAPGTGGWAQVTVREAGDGGALPSLPGVLAPAAGCGCGAGGVALGLWAGLAWLGVRRRVAARRPG
jgi:PKD repeat protein